MVGENGSGKSTLLKILSRSHEQLGVQGEVYIDGHPIEVYAREEYLRHVVELSQDFCIFKELSVRENIGLGDSDAARNDDKIREAARKGGALSFITKLDNGFDTILEPVEDTVLGDMSMVSADESDPLRALKMKMSATLTRELSGGEEQRIVA